MKNFMHICFDPQEDGAAGGGDLDLNASFMQDDKPADDVKVEDTPKDDAVKTDDVKADDKIDDPEVEMDWDEGEGKKAKMKMSELRQQAKWLKENEHMIAGTLRIREESAKNPALAKALQGVIAKAYNEKGEYQGAAVDKIVASLEAKEEALQEKVDDKTDEIAEMQKELEEIDPDSPHAKILQRNINATKALRAQLSQALEANKKIQDRLDGLDKFKTDLTKKEEDKVTGEKVKQVSEIFSKELGALMDVTKKDGLKFIDESEKQEFDRALRDAVASKSQAIKSDADFIKVIRDEAKSLYSKLTARKEAYIADYLKAKNGPERKVEQKEEVKKDRSFVDMGDALADAMMIPPA